MQYLFGKCLAGQNNFSEKIESLNDIIEAIAGKFNQCRYIDLYSLFIDETGNVKEETLSADGVHLSGEGYRLWIDEIQRYIKG